MKTYKLGLCPNYEFIILLPDDIKLIKFHIGGWPVDYMENSDLRNIEITRAIHNTLRNEDDI